MNNLQKKLLNFTETEMKLAKLEITPEQYQKNRGITAFWNDGDERAYITFYFDGEITKTDFEIASDICAYIISHLTKGMLQEQYIRLDYPGPLPPSLYWAYKRNE